MITKCTWSKSRMSQLRPQLQPTELVRKRSVWRQSVWQRKQQIKRSVIDLMQKEPNE